MVNLTTEAIKAAAPGDVLWDAKVKGLQLRAFDNRKSFYLYFRTKAGVQRRPKLGDWGSITLEQARRAASAKLEIVAAGRDPEAELEAQAKAPTVQDLWDRFWTDHASQKKTSAEDGRRWNKTIKPALARKKVADVAYEDVLDLHRKLPPIEANRTLALLSVMFGYAFRPLKWVEANPCAGVKRNKETKRRRYMTGAEAMRIADILRRESEPNPQSVAFLYLLILTGARKGEIAKAKWSQLHGNKLVLSEHKTDHTGEDRVIQLPPQAMEVIRKLPVVLHGTITGIQSPKKLWDRIRIEAECPDLRMHDLRHSFASAALAAGYTLNQIGELLGHRSEQTTKRYAHLIDEAAAGAAADIAGRIADAMKMA